MTNINEQAILNLFSELPIGEVFETIFNEDFPEDETTQICGGLLIPAAVQLFAEKYHSFERTDDEDDLNPFWELFCRQQQIDSDLQNVISQSINEAAAEYSNDDSDDDYEDEPAEENNDDDVGIVDQDEWSALSEKDRLAKVKKFLAALANAHDDINNLRPFLKTLPTNSDYLGNNFGSKVQVRSNRYGPAEDLDESVSRKHFREIAATVAQIKDPKTRQEISDAHAAAFAKMNPRFSHEKWHAAAGTKAGKSTIKETGLLPSTKITEQLLDPQSDKIRGYVEFMNRTHVNTLNCSESPAEALRAAHKLKNEHDEKFKNGDAEYDPSDFIFGRNRPGKRK